MAIYSQNGELILASASPRRKELLELAGLKFSVEPSAHPESVLKGEAPHDFAARVALEKAGSVAGRHPHSWVIGADTSVVLGSRIFGKPADEADAVRMLMELQGRVHQVVGAFAVKGPGTAPHVEVHSTDVVMRALSQAEISGYVESGEPMDKAGAYAIQGAGGAFVESVSGSFSNVIGLNISALIKSLFGLGAVS